MNPDTIQEVKLSPENEPANMVVEICFWLKEIAYQLAVMNEGNGTGRS